MNSNKKIDYRTKIIKKLSESASGLTITEISNKTDIHRNTVSKYLGVLEAEGLVKKKEIGAASLYFFSKKRKYLRKNLVTSFLQALLYGLKEEFPDNPAAFKKVGLKILEYFDFPIGNSYIREFERVRSDSDVIDQLKLFQKFYNSYDFFQDDLDISILELHQNKITYRIKNSEFLNDNFIYFFYIACGITEGIYLQNLNKNVNCNVENVNIAEDKDECFIDISLEIK